MLKLISLITSILCLTCCKPDAKGRFQKLSGLYLPSTAESVQVAFGRVNEAYVVGDLVMTARLSRSEFDKFIQHNGFLKQKVRVWAVGQVHLADAAWWNPPHPAFQDEVFVKKMQPDGDWIGVCLWKDGLIYYWQNGPFE